MPEYTQHVEHYGDQGLISEEDIVFVLEGEDEQRYLAPDRVQQAYATLRQWSLDAQDAHDTWPSKDATQKDAAIRETIRRLGIFMDRLADVLLMDGRSGT